MEIRELIEKIIKDREAVGGIKCVVWVAAGLNAAVLICGGPGMAYSALALDLFDQYTAE